ncbi:MAG: GAF domain-containing protein [Deltaproteobacteria bacterium]|nr:GAF domain-containing protein [Deltaproteobacteria bacterium]
MTNLRAKTKEELLLEVAELRQKLDSEMLERKKTEAEHELNAGRLNALVKLNQMEDAPLAEIADFVLEQGVRLTKSNLGFISFVSMDETVITIHAWSKTAMEQCRLVDKPIIYEVEKTGLWGEPIRQRRVIIVNDYSAPNQLKRSYPEGHVPVTRFMGVPLFDGKKIVALAGLSNKETEYNETDALQIRLLMEGMWRLTQKVEITKEKENLQKQLFQSQKMEALGELAGGIAHDFNNIITVIKVLSGMALSQTPEENQSHDLLKKINEAARRAESITRQLLILSRRNPPDFKPLGINEVVKDLTGMLVHLLRKNITLNAELDKNLREVIADKGNIQQLVLNLIMNARDAIYRKGEITIRTENFELDAGSAQDSSYSGKFICLTVEDTGKGMEREVMDHIFEPLFTTKGIGKGTGLGLVVVDNIVKQHNGWITVSSDLGKGSSFKIYFPAVPQEAAQATEKKKPSDLQGRGKRVLYVEDEKMLRKSVAMLLSKHGYSVYEASNVKDAEEIFERENGRFDLLFTDTVLTDENGIVLIERLRAKNKELRVLLTSGYLDIDCHWPEIKSKGYGFLQKPYEPVTLLHTFREVCTEVKLL